MFVGDIKRMNREQYTDPPRTVKKECHFQKNPKSGPHYMHCRSWGFRLFALHFFSEDFDLSNTLALFETFEVNSTDAPGDGSHCWQSLLVQYVPVLLDHPTHFPFRVHSFH